VIEVQVDLGGRIRTCASGVDQRAGPVDPLPSVDGALLDDSACVLGIDLGDEDRMMDLVAVAMVRLAWRDGPVEDWHKEGHICNSEMMRASAATTRLVREILSGGRRRMTGGDTVSLMGETVDAVGRALVDPDRHLPDGRTLTELAPDAEQLAAFERHVWMFCTRWNRVAAKYGVQETIGLLALYSGCSCWRWWLAPGWHHRVDEYVRRLDDPARWSDPVMTRHVARLGAPDVGGADLRALLLDGPDRLTAAAAERCFWTGLAGLRPLDCGQPPVPRRVLPPGYLALVTAPLPFAN
jgi:hypothetical protein